MNHMFSHQSNFFKALAIALMGTGILLQYAIREAAAANLTWNTTSGSWDTTSHNWIGGATFTGGDNVTFGDIASDSVITVVGGGVGPGSALINNSANKYTFAGGSINGIGALTKLGGGTAALTAANGYLGGTFVTGGTLIVDGGNTRLGGPNGSNLYGGLSLDGGTLQTNTAGIVAARDFTVGLNGGTYNSNGFNAAFSGATTINGTFVKSGVGDIAFSGGVTFSASGNMTINTGGTVTLAGTGACQFNNATFNGNLIIANPIRVDFNTATFGGSGQIKVQNPGVVGTALTLISNSSGYSGGGTLNVGIALNSLGLPFTKSDVTRAPFAPPASNSFITAIGGTKDNFTAILTIGGVIDGYSDVIFGSNDQVGASSGAGGVVLTAANTYKGTTMISGNGPDPSATNATGSVILGINNALPTSTDVIFGYPNNSPSRPTPIDLHGFNQQIGSLSNVPGASNNFQITNSGTTLSTLTIAGSTTPANPFAGIIQDGAGPVKLVKNTGTTSTLWLSNANTYSGGTIISAGTLHVSNTSGSGTGTGTVMVQTGASLAGDPVGGTVGGADPVSGLVTIQSGGKLLPGGSGTAGSALNIVGGLQLNSGSQVSFDFAPGNNFRDEVSVGGVLNLPTSGSVTINLNNLGGITHTLPLFTFDTITNPFSASQFSIGTSTGMPGGVTFGFQIDTLNSKQIDLLINGIPDQANVIWSTSSGIWDTVNNNWTGGTPDAAKYKDGDNATFADIAGNTVITVAAGGVTPGATVVSNSANTYTFQGGVINGYGPLNKSGAGTLVLAASNGYQGGTNVTGGKLVVDGGDTRLGAQSGLLTLDGGSTLQTQTAGLSFTGRNVTIGSGGATFDTNGLDSTTTGVLTINGTLAKIGAGTLTVGPNIGTTGSPGAIFGSSGLLDVQNGDVVFHGQVKFGDFGALNIHSGSSVTFDYPNSRDQNGHVQRNGGRYDGNLIVTNAIRLNFDGGTFEGSGEIKLQAPAYWSGTYNGSFTQTPLITCSNFLDTNGGTINTTIHLNSTDLPFTKSDVTHNAANGKFAPPTANSFVVSIGGTNGGTSVGGSKVTIAGNITGNADVSFGNNDPAGGGSGHLMLTGHSTYTGTTMINGNLGYIHLGTDNPLPTGTDVVFGTLGSTASPTIDLNGHNLEIGSLSCGGWVKSGGSSHNFNIQNAAWGIPATLTVSGSTTPANSFDGTITDGPFGGTIQLVKAGAGTLTLGYLNNYTGGTIVRGGTLTFTAAARMGGIDGAGLLEVSNLNTGVGSDVFLNLNSAYMVSMLSGTIATASSGTNHATINLLGGPASILTVNQNDDTLYAGSITGMAGLVKTGTGSLTIAGSITYSGDTTVNAGTLTVGKLDTPLWDVAIDGNSTLYAGSLSCDTLTLGPGCRVVIEPIPGGPLAVGTPGGIVAVPEPSTLLLLTLAGLALAGMRHRLI